MYNPEQPQPPPPQLMAPRMSFSSDFALEPPPPPSGPARAGDADFEFTPVGSRPMMAADQLFSKGRILPLREAASCRGPVTLRDELRAPDAGAGRRMPRWKELLGLKRRTSTRAPPGEPQPRPPPTLMWILETVENQGSDPSERTGRLSLCIV